MIKYILLLLPIFAFSNEIRLEHTQMKPLGKSIKTNARITQLSDQKQKIVSRLSGHVEAYFVKSGQKVRSGDKVALIESIELSKMSAEYLALIQQTNAVKKQLNSEKKLFQKGLSSQNDLNERIIALEEIRSKQNTLASQFRSLGILPSKLTKATDQLILYAHADGVVGQIFISLHSNVDAHEPLMSIVDQSGYYAVAYISVNDAMKVTPETAAILTLAGKNYPCRFVQLLPNIDEETQRAKVLFQIEKNSDNLLLGAYTQIEISIPPYTDAIMVKKSALTLFKGEWVVFTPQEEEYHEEKADHKKESDHDEHKEHEENESSTYIANVVEIIAYNGNDVAIRGLHKNEEYVSDGVYYVKSMLLKSSLGEHGH